ncbi:helix-turn-helix transcriptional regulator [Neobacillus sp. D3-1R]|uniref:helix-turn-helix transcriptional regulator n=1 Tax=Neobacillus sp. D3-1R TaxID=3445778 RepID=UPI003FA0C362
MRADRLINIMTLLQNRGKMTSKELATELDVSERTINRDMEALSASGIPVISDRGKEGGWRLMDNFRSRLTGLKLEEIKTLFLSPFADYLKDLGIEPNQSIDTRHKLLATIPSHYQHEAKMVWERIYIDTGNWRQTKEKLVCFQTAQQAVFENRKLKIVYGQSEENAEERMIEPLGLVVQSNKWYLVALKNGEFRNYRLSRIYSASLEEGQFERPESFDLAEYWNQSKSAFIQNLPSYVVEVEVSPEDFSRINFTGKFIKVIKTESPTAGHWIPATLNFHSEQEAVEYILGFSKNIRIVEPQTLIEKVVQGAKDVLEFYQSK